MRLQLFEEMLAAKLVPDAAQFAMLITACERKVPSHAVPHALHDLTLLCLY